MPSLIELTQGKFAVADDEDFEWLSQWSWHTHATPESRTYYAVANSCNTSVRMHRLVMGVTDPNIEVDHKNRCGLDNRRDNLRIATHTQNMQNKGLRMDNTSGFKGVHWSNTNKLWASSICVNKEDVWVGYFDSPVDAALAYDAAARKHFKEFAWLNFPNVSRPPPAPRVWREVLPRGESGYLGVTRHSGKWAARVTDNGKRRRIGSFDSPKEAARAYDRAMRSLNGPEAFTNFPDRFDACLP